MTTPGVSMNITVFKELNDQLNTVSQGTDIFRSKITGLIKDLQGLTQVISGLPGGLDALNRQMTGGGAARPNSNPAFDAQGIINQMRGGNATSPQQPQQPTTFTTAGGTFSFDAFNKSKEVAQELSYKFKNYSTGGDFSRDNSKPVLEPQQTPLTWNRRTETLFNQGKFFQEAAQAFKITQGQLEPALNRTKANEQIDKLIEQLAKVDKTLAVTLSKELGNLKNELGDTSTVFQKYDQALARYTTEISKSQPDQKVLKDVTQNLADATRNVTDLSKKFGDLTKASQQVLGGIDGTNWTRMGNVAGGLGILANIASSQTKAGFDFYRDMETRDITAGRETLTGRGALARRQYEIQTEQYDLYNARNLMKWGGDILTPGMTQYAGREGFARARQRAFEELTREQQLKETEQKTNLGTGALDIGAGAAQLLAGLAIKRGAALAGAAVAGPLAPIIGGAVAIDAALDIGGAAGSMFRQYAAAPAEEIRGGRAQTLYGKMTNAIFGTQASDEMARRTRDRFATEQANQLLERARQYQESEVERSPLIEKSLQKYQDLKQARYQALSQLGAAAGLPIFELDRESKQALANVFNVGEESYKKNIEIGTKAAGLNRPSLKETIRSSLNYANPTQSQLDAFERQLRGQFNNRFAVFDENITPEGRQRAFQEYVADPNIRNRFKPGTAAYTPTGLLPQIITTTPQDDAKNFLIEQSRKAAAEKQAKTDLEVMARDKAVEDARKATDETLATVMQRTMEQQRRGPFASLGIGVTELQQRAYQFQLAQSPSARQMTTKDAINNQQFQELNRMSIGGFGSFEQLANNITMLGQIRGGNARQNQEELKTILAKGVEAGFNNSRLSQSLVQTTADLAASLNLRTMGGVSSTLLEGARAVAGGGDISERALRESAAGIQRYAQFTGQREGPMAALRMAGILQSGLTPGRGAGMLFGMNAIQAQDMQNQITQLMNKSGARNVEDLSSWAKANPEKIQDADLRALLIAGDSKQVLGGLQRIQRVGTDVVAGLWNRAGYKGTFQEARDAVQDALKSAKTPGEIKEAQRKLAEFESFTRMALEPMGKEAVGMTSGIIGQLFSNMGMTDTQKAKFQTQQQKAAAAVDEERKVQVAFEHTLASMGKEIGGRTFGAKSYVEALKAGRMGATIEGKTYTADELEAKMKEPGKAGEEFTKKVEEQAKSTTMTDLIARRAAASQDPTQQIQNTNISGISVTASNQLADAIAMKLRPVTNPPAPVAFPSGAK